ncbi:MazG nucleotide pyrophosphohydrolase domain-containing protein [Rathayibacter sp. KR2-224]|uniref:MazG nucleotide pyrophosphohydrolase domain-containing protein n=1 Tax=Rathayibacter sp. KR2-224 TaxID=3400913 RepID=UPI003C07899E
MAWDTERTRRLLIEAAAVEFSEHGLAGARVDTIATRAGVNKERIYQYFGSKQKLFGAVLETELLTAMDAVVMEGRGVEAVSSYAARLFDYQCGRPHLARLLFWEGLELKAPAAGQERGARYDTKLAALSEALPDLSSDDTRDLFVSIVTIVDSWVVLGNIERLVTHTDEISEERVGQRREAVRRSVAAIASAQVRGEYTRSRLDEFADAMASVLDKCVWSQTMTHETLVPYLIEETYELVDAIETGTTDEIIEELGDVLWQVAFHSEIASRTAEGSGDQGPFDIQDVADRVTQKMVRRHPHVFGDEVAETPEEVLRLWNAAKAAEKSTRRSVLEGIPQGMPALALADKVIGRAQRLGVSPSEPEGLPSFDDEAELGELLLGVVSAARTSGLDAERALRSAIRGLQDDARAAEQQVSAR